MFTLTAEELFVHCWTEGVACPMIIIDKILTDLSLYECMYAYLRIECELLKVNKFLHFSSTVYVIPRTTTKILRELIRKIFVK